MKLTHGVFVVTITLAFLASCKDKTPKEKQNLFSGVALSTIHEQIAHVDTALYSIIRIVTVDTNKSDTTYLKREEFKEAAREFTTIPDLSDSKYYGRFKEDNAFDENLGRAIIVYTPVNVEKEEIQREEILIQPESPKDKVTTIIVNTNISNKDSSIEKRMMWHVDQSFQVTTIKQYPGKPEITTTYKVVWNEDSE